MKDYSALQNIPKIGVSFQRKTETELFIHSSKDSFILFRAVWNVETLQLYEEFKAIYIGPNNKVIGYRNISRGNASQTVVNIRLILSIALLSNASGIILGHNHPSGNLQPSRNDFQLTEHLKKGAKLFGIQIFDHLIISSHSYYSFCDEGVLASM